MFDIKASQLSLYAFVCLLVCVGGCSNPRSQLEQIIDRGSIKVVTHSGPATFYVDKDGETGLEYELASRFADYLGVELDLVVARNNSEVEKIMLRAQADIAAGDISKSNNPESFLVYGPGYHWVTRQIVYRKNHARPSSLKGLAPDKLHLTHGMISDQQLQKLKIENPTLEWVIHSDKDDVELLNMVENGEIFYALIHSNDVVRARSTYPEVRPAFNLTGPEPLAWAVRHSNDHSLLDKIQEFHTEISHSGELADLIEKFYGPRGFFDYVDSRAFIKKLRTVLPSLKPYFKRSAEQHNLDWRLLAAMSYQESHWNKHARSSTGVRGLMMLTQSTAKQLGIENRLDPEQSIEGGARYLVSLIKRMPERIAEPDRTWLALASYNVGFGHLEDARVLTDRNGGNPDLWEDVKLRLPLLSKREWHRKTRHGYARGNEPVKFVNRINKYYNVLVQLTQQPASPEPQEIEAIAIDSPAL